MPRGEEMLRLYMHASKQAVVLTTVNRTRHGLIMVLVLQPSTSYVLLAYPHSSRRAFEALVVRYSARTQHLAAVHWFSWEPAHCDMDVDIDDTQAAAAGAPATAVAAVATTTPVVTAAAGEAGGSVPRVEVEHTRSLEVISQRFEAMAVGLSPAEQEALLAAVERRRAQLAQDKEREEQMAEYRRLQEQLNALATRLNIAPPSTDTVSTSSGHAVDVVNDAAILHGLLQRFLQQETRRPVDVSGEGTAGPGGSKAALAKSMNRPKVWEGPSGGTRRAIVFLREIKTWAELHGGKGEDILQSYLGDRVKGLFIQQLDAWAAEGIEATWDRMCEAFCTIVGETEAEEKAKSLDDFTGFKVRQKKHQSLGEYKVYFQNELLRAGGGLPEPWAVRFFINGLGSRELKAACQPELTAGKIKTVDEAFICAKGQEAKLLAAGIQPYSGLPHNSSGSGSGTLAFVQGKPRNGGGHNGQQSNRSGVKRPREQGYQAGQHSKPLPKGWSKNRNGFLVDESGNFRCTRCHGTRDRPSCIEDGSVCSKGFHRPPGPPRT